MLTEGRQLTVLSVGEHDLLDSCYRATPPAQGITLTCCFELRRNSANFGAGVIVK